MITNRRVVGSIARPGPNSMQASGRLLGAHLLVFFFCSFMLLLLLLLYNHLNSCGCNGPTETVRKIAPEHSTGNSGGCSIEGNEIVTPQKCHQCAEAPEGTAAAAAAASNSTDTC